MKTTKTDRTTAHGGTDDACSEGFRQIRHSLAASVIARLKDEIPGLSPHFGEHYAETDDPEVIVYHGTGGAFRFLAFAFSPWRMWDLHVGVVPIDDQKLSIGFHISERAATAMFAELEKLGAGIGATARHQQAAVEYQANLPPFEVRDVALPVLVDTVADLCRRYAAVVARVSCPNPWWTYSA